MALLASGGFAANDSFREQWAACAAVRCQILTGFAPISGHISIILGGIHIKVPKYLEWGFECSKKHSEKKLAQKNTQQIKSTFLSPQIIAQ